MNHYINQEELLAEVKKSKTADRATEKLGLMFLTLTDHILRGQSFSRYQQELKEDMKSYALEKLIKAIDTVKVETGPQMVFNYFTRTVFTAYLTVIAKHYKNENLKRDITRRFIMKNPEMSLQQKEQLLAGIPTIDGYNKKKGFKNKTLKAVKKSK